MQHGILAGRGRSELWVFHVYRRWESTTEIKPRTIKILYMWNLSSYYVSLHFCICICLSVCVYLEE